MSRMAAEVFEALERARRIRAGTERRRFGDVVRCLFAGGCLWVYSYPGGGSVIPDGEIKRFCVRCGRSEI